MHRAEAMPMHRQVCALLQAANERLTKRHIVTLPGSKLRQTMCVSRVENHPCHIQRRKLKMDVFIGSFYRDMFKEWNRNHINRANKEQPTCNIWADCRTCRHCELFWCSMISLGCGTCWLHMHGCRFHLKKSMPNLWKHFPNIRSYRSIDRFFKASGAVSLTAFQGPCRLLGKTATSVGCGNKRFVQVPLTLSAAALGKNQIPSCAYGRFSPSCMIWFARNTIFTTFLQPFV